MDLETDLDQRPAARQLRRSLLNYMAANSFSPAQQLTVEQLETVFQEPSPYAKLGATVTADSEHPGYEAGNVLDGDPATFWHTPWGDTSAPYPHWIRIDFKQPVTLYGIAVTPRQDMTNGHVGKYAVYLSDTQNVSGRPTARGAFPEGSETHEIRFEEPARGTHLHVQAMRPGNPDHPWATIAEIQLLMED
jgi:hypothetical protein